MLEIQSRQNLRRNRSLVGTETEILVEGVSPRDSSRLIGRTNTNLIGVFERPGAGKDLVGTLARLLINDCTPLTLYGSLITG